MTTNRIKVLAADVLSRGFNFNFKIHGNSMRPLIRDGDYLTVSPANHLKKGDIVLYFSPSNKLVVHRISKIKNNLIITKGDSVRGLDCPIKRETVLGKVVMIERGNKKRDLEGGIWKLINLSWARAHLLFLSLRTAMRRIIISPSFVLPQRGRK